MGGAATALVRDASAPWYNPAGLGRVSAQGITASVSAYGLQWERTGRRSNGDLFTVQTLGVYHLHDVTHHLWDVTPMAEPGAVSGDL